MTGSNDTHHQSKAPLDYIQWKPNTLIDLRLGHPFNSIVWHDELKRDNLSKSKLLHNTLFGIRDALVVNICLSICATSFKFHLKFNIRSPIKLHGGSKKKKAQSIWCIKMVQCKKPYDSLYMYVHWTLSCCPDASGAFEWLINPCDQLAYVPTS